MKAKIKIHLRLLTFFLMLWAGQAMGQETAEAAVPAYQITLNTVIYFFSFILLIIATALYSIATHLKRFMREEMGDKVVEKKPSIWSKILQIKSSDTDKDTIIDHPHDGIYELDNPAPPWFMYLFYSTIIIAVIYYVRFTFTDSGYTQYDEYQAELDQAEEARALLVSSQGKSVDENTVTLLLDEPSLSKGKLIYNENCFACHGKYAEGLPNSGPNLRDEYWKHGGSVKDVFSTIKYGVVDKGMAEWQKMMGPESLQAVTSYVLSLQKEAMPADAKPKEAEGDLYKAVDASNAESDTTQSK
ncbi:MAG: cytochrome c oxidase cbb3-type subunit 3 [Bacteroidia bacterium]|jgi:cytochrome c oxidase cbb3-type subunit 3